MSFLPRYSYPFLTKYRSEEGFFRYTGMFTQDRSHTYGLTKIRHDSYLSIKFQSLFVYIKSMNWCQWFTKQSTSRFPVNYRVLGTRASSLYHVHTIMESPLACTRASLVTWVYGFWESAPPLNLPSVLTNWNPDLSDKTTVFQSPRIQSIWSQFLARSCRRCCVVIKGTRVGLLLA